MNNLYFLTYLVHHATFKQLVNIMKRFTFFISLLISSSLFASSPLIYGVKSTDKSINTSYDVILQKKALDKDFLLIASRIYGYPVATGSSLKSKIVFFERRENKIFMFENTKGLMISDSLKTKVLLASFPIIFENNKEIAFDFDKGMSTLLIQGSMHSSDYNVDSEDYAIVVDDSFIEKVENKENYVFIDQFIRVSNKTYRMKYELSLYNPSKTFNPKKSTLLKKVGYFETHPILDPEATDRDKVKNYYILKYDENKPITYHISANTPKEYLQAVKDGVLYWNKALGKDLIKVKVLKDERTPHDPNLNLVQWVDWSTAGFAYANIQADPLTGQTLNSTVYMTSSFALSSVKEAKETLLKLTLEKKEEDQKVALALKGFDEHHLCNLDAHNVMTHGLTQSLNEVIELPKKEQEAIIRRISQDHIAAVVAHEVGHTLGLRHNFAGTVKGNITQKQWKSLLKDYILKDEVNQDYTVSTTLMDYTSLLVSAFNGAKIRTSQPVLAYDKVAIEWGYSKKKIEEFETPLFCTDSHVSKYMDCERWDQFDNPASSALESLEYAIKYSPFYLFNSFISLTEKKDDESLVWEYLAADERVQKIESVRLSPERLANWIATKWEKVIKMSSKNARYLKVESNFPYINDFNDKEVREKTIDYIKESFKNYGGITKAAIFPFYLNVNDEIRFKSNFDKLFVEYMAPFSSKFDSNEIDIINKKAKRFSHLLERELLIKLANILSKNKFAYYSKPIELTVMDWIKKILFTSSDKLLFTLKDGVEFKEFKYQFTNMEGKDLRSEFIKLLTSDIFEGQPNYTRRRKKSSYALYDIFKKNIDQIKGDQELSEFDDDVYNWMYNEAQRFYPLIPSRRAPNIFDRL